MATNRGAYDPRQFLHYPDKNPFSDESQKQLDNLIQDFLRSGIAFANGASVSDLIAEEERASAESSPHCLNGRSERWEQSSPGAVEDDEAGGGESDDNEYESRRVDKGKGRDEREGPGVQGLWARTNALTSWASPLRGSSADDAISLSSGSESTSLLQERVGLEDEEGSYVDDPYQDGSFEEGFSEDEQEGLREDTSEDGTRSESPRSHASKSKREILYIGDSDEDDPKSHAPSAEGDSDHRPGLTHSEARGNQPEHASGSQLEETGEDVLRDLRYSRDTKDEAGDGHHHRRHPSQDNEVEGIFLQGKERYEDRLKEILLVKETDTNSFARHFSSSSPFNNAWVPSGSECTTQASVSALSMTLGLQNHPSSEQGKKITEPEALGSSVLDSSELETPELRPDLKADAVADGLSQPLKSGQRIPENISTADATIAGRPSVSDQQEAIPISPPELTVLNQEGDDGINTVCGDEGESHFPKFTVLDRHDGIPTTVCVTRDEEFSVPRNLNSLFAVHESAVHSSIHPVLPLTSAHSDEMPSSFKIMPAKFPNTNSHESADPQGFHPVLETRSSLLSNGTDIAQPEGEDGHLFDDSTPSSVPPTEPILRKATFSQDSDGSREQFGLIDVDVEVVTAAPRDDTQQSLSSTNSADSSSSIPSGNISLSFDKDVPTQNTAGDLQSVSRGLPEAGKKSSSTDGADEESHNYQFNETISHHVMLDDHDHQLENTHYRFPSPVFMPKAGSTSPSLECRSVTSADLHGNEVTREPYTVVEDRSESDQDAGRKELEAEEVPRQAKDTIGGILPDHVLNEAVGEGRDRDASGEGESRVVEQTRANTEFQPPLGPIPAVSVGSTTPPLSPATVTNCSSAPDPSVATSDLSTINPPTVSVIASTSSPPPIHVSHPSLAPTDIRQPHGSRVDFASDEDQEEETVLPDPRLPPEPTHLRIPVGVFSRGLTDDKQELAESVKVEPPTSHVTSESEDGSVAGLGETLNGKVLPNIGAEVTTDRPVPEDDVASSKLGNLAVPDGGISMVSPESQANEDKEVDRMDVGRGNSDLSLELSYPDSLSDHPSEERGASTSPLDQPSNVHAGRERSISPRQTDDTPMSLFHVPNSISESAPVPQKDENHQDSFVDGTALATETPSVDCHTGPLRNGDTMKSTLLSDSPLSSPEPTHSDLPVTPTINEGDLSNDGSQNPRSSGSTKKQVKHKGKSQASQPIEVGSVSPPPQSTIRVQAKTSSTSRKRSRSSDVAFEPSKQRRVTRSAGSRKSSTLSDIASVSAVSDDISEVSSVASSSSAVSHILRSTSSKPPSLLTDASRSPSVVSQSSPIGANATPLRPYIPHSHSHHTPTPSVSTGRSRRHKTPEPHRNTAELHSPSVIPQTTPTHQTRASCTDHKISIPGRDGLIYFLIPRCSLLDPEVEKDDRIVDCGVATTEEVKRAIGDLEAVGLDSEILGVIRQLAGVQLMREGQVGYLPKPGERVRRRGMQKRSLPTQDVNPQVELVSRPPWSIVLGDHPPASHESPSRRSSSEATKAEDALSCNRNESEVSNAGGNKTTPEDGDEGEDENKRQEVTLDTPRLPSPKADHVPKSIRTRRRGLRTEDAAYKPENEDSESGSDEPLEAKKKPKASLKRKRSEPPTPEENMSPSAVESGKSPAMRRQKRKQVESQVKGDDSREDVSDAHRTMPRQATTGSP